MDIFYNIFAILIRAIAILTIIHLLMDNRQPAKTMAWALVIFFFPTVGIIAYAFFGTNTRRERRIRRISLDKERQREMLNSVAHLTADVPDAHQTLANLFSNQKVALPFKGNVEDIFISGGPFFDDLISEMEKARTHIHINMYIFANDELGEEIAEVMKRKAREGVEVRLIYDDVGCWRVPQKFFDDMTAAGIEACAFLPVRFPKFARKANYRDHRKLIVIDGHTGYIGGMNIARRYRDGADGRPWRDTMAKISGPAVYGLQHAFLTDWHFVSNQIIDDGKYYPPFTDTPPPTTHHPSPTTEVERLLVQVVTSGPFAPYPELMQGYAHLILNARKYVYMETPYFMPTEAVMIALKTAAQSGVDVRLTVPLKGDSLFVEWSSRSYLREAAEAGVKVFLYSPGFIHSKMLVTDDTLATCGSTNIDFRSFENNFEANAFFYGSDTAKRFKNIFLANQQQSINATACPAYRRRRFPEQLLESLARLTAPLF